MWLKLFKPTNKKRVFFFLSFDILISLLTIICAYMLRFNFSIPDDFVYGIFILSILLVPAKIVIFSFSKIYFVAWRYFGLLEYKRIVNAHLIAYAIAASILLLFRDMLPPFPRSVLIIDLFLSLFFLGLLRISRRVYLESSQSATYAPALIIGVNSKTSQIIKSASEGSIQYSPVALLSDQINLLGTYFADLKIYGDDKLEDVIAEYEVSSVIIARSMNQGQLDQLFTKLKHIGIDDIKIAQIFQKEQTALKDIAIEDLLARKPKDLDTKVISPFVADKVVLITGAGGSIGSELSRQVASFGARQIILVDHSEFNLYQISESLSGYNIISVMIDIKNRANLDEIMALYRPGMVIHAAAYKHVPLCEENQASAVANNIQGSMNLIDLSIKYKVDKVVIISTDKAVRPTNVMGATKRVVELYADNVDSENTDIVAVRFGNVLGSSGSVIPKFKEQISAGGPVTVTHPEINRYFMLIPEACQLVLQAAAIAKGGELFVLDMGEPIRIVDLARQMIRLHGKEDEIEIEFTGLRAGEKLYEELLLDDNDKQTKYSSIFIASPTAYDIIQLREDIEYLMDSSDKIKALQKIVPEFAHENMV